tara:strand:- start:40 stop:951 length:912 start_codon:yes stop_codon:yes gene_type:complete
MPQPTAANDRNFGVELELIVDDDDALARHLRSEGVNIRCEGYNHETRGHWKIVSDSSVRGTHPREHNLLGREIVSPILCGEHGREQVRALLDAAETYRGVARVNRTCGMHVHISCADLSLKQIKRCAKAQLKYEWVLDQFVPASRRANENQFCYSVSRSFGDGNTLSSIEETGFSMIDSARDLYQLRGMVQRAGGRQTKWNLDRYTDRGTIEIRHGGGTLDADKACNWIELWTSFFTGFADARLRPSRLNHEQSNTNNSPGQLTLDKAIRRLFKHIRAEDGSINKPLRKYFQQRARDLNPAIN